MKGRVVNTKLRSLKKNSKFKEIEDNRDRDNHLNDENDPYKNKEANERNSNDNLNKPSLEIVYSDSFCYFKKPSPILKIEKSLNNNLEYVIHNKANKIEIKRVI